MTCPNNSLIQSPMKPLNIKQIKRFLKKVNYGQPVTVVYLKETKKEQKNPNFLCAQAAFQRYIAKKNSKEIVMYYRVEINKRWKKLINNIDLKCVLLHEIGHFYSGFIIKHNKLIEKPKSLCELEAQIWGLKRAKSLKLKHIRREMTMLFYEWSMFNYKSPERIYLNAYRLAVKRGILKDIKLI